MRLEERFIFYRKGNSGSTDRCPQCNKPKEFTRYVDQVTGELLPDHVGVCNNINKCGYKYTWIEFLRDNQDYLNDATWTRSFSQRPAVIQQPKPVDYFPERYIAKSLNGYDQNNFVRYLRTIFPEEIVAGLIDRYKIGTSQSPWPGSTIFWQIDRNGNGRTGKIMLYHPTTGKRVKRPYNHFQWAHSLLKKFGRAENFNLRQCLYGEHLITLSDQIAIVEAEKTAIVGSVFYPKFVWLATGGLNNLSPERFEALKGKEVILFPDKGCYDAWMEKGKKLGIPNVRISSYIESLSIPDGGDLADYLPDHATIPERHAVEKGYPPEWDAKGSPHDV